MSEIEETASQRQARIRRERREAKIKTGGADRLDKITRLSGRTPELGKPVFKLHIVKFNAHT